MTFPTIADLFPAGSLAPALSKTYFQALLQTLLDRFGDGSTAQSVRDSMGISVPAVQNIIRNGSFKVNQRVTMPTTDNSFGPDGWRLLMEAANACVMTISTADVPTGARNSIVLTVGSGNNNKFGIWQPIESLDSTELRSKVVSMITGLKATAGLTNGTGKIRIGICGFTGTADAISGDPISSWGAEGTNPTLAASWSYLNTPAALSVGTTWADHVVENVSVGASVNNLALFIWSDDKTNTQTTDVLRIGGYVTMAVGAKAPLPQVGIYSDELRRCERYMEKSFEPAQAPASSAGTTGAVSRMQVVGASAGTNIDDVVFKTVKRTPPTVTTYNPSAAGAQPVNSGTGGSGSGITTVGNTSCRGFTGTFTTPAGTSAGSSNLLHFTAIDGTF